MKIFPAIDIKDKKCVRLIKGEFENKTEYDQRKRPEKMRSTPPRHSTLLTQ